MTTADASTDLGLIPGADRPRRGREARGRWHAVPGRAGA